MTKRKVNIIFGLTIMVFIFGFLLSYLLIPAYIGEDENELFDIVPKNVLLIFSILILMLIIFLQLKYRLIISGYVINFLPIKILTTIIVFPFISVLLSFMILFNFYSYVNYSFINDIVTISGKIYKTDIQKSNKESDKYYIYFDELHKYKMKVPYEKYNNFRIGDDVSLKVTKGRISGYYLISDEIIKNNDLIDLK